MKLLTVMHIRTPGGTTENLHIHTGHCILNDMNGESSVVQFLQYFWNEILLKFLTSI